MVETVIKRNGSKVKFNKNKILRAMENAFNEVDSVSEDLLAYLTDQVIEKIDTKEPTVEQIQDVVEKVLMENDFVDVAKRYILYRYKRNHSRKNKKESIFDDEFISKYKHKPNPFPTELGEFIYYRTYSRWLPEEERREYWWETVKRAVEYNTSLVPTSKEEAEKLFDNVYNFRQFLAGRTLWIGGTEVSRKYPMRNYNCAFTVINDFSAYKELYYLLLIGSGVGFRVLPEDVEKLP